MFTMDNATYLEAAKIVMELREQYGIAEPLDAEIERINLKIAAMLNETEKRHLMSTTYWIPPK